MTAVAIGNGFARRPGAVAPAPSAAALSRVVGSWREPNFWTVGILLVAGVGIIARHPLAEAFGTQPGTPVVAVPAAPGASSAIPARSATTLPALSALPVPTHAPVDPFRALVAPAGAALASTPAAPSTPAGSTTTPVGSTTTPATPTTPSTPVVPTGCASTYTVVAGDSLWSIAAKVTGSTATGRVTVAWHRLYAANRAAIGANPSLVRVGEKLCMPSSL